MQRRHDDSPPLEKLFWTAPPAEKQTASVFWGMEGSLLIEWLPQAQSTNSEVSCNILSCIRSRIQLRRQGKWTRQVLLFHDSARPYSSKQTTQIFVSFGHTVLPQPQYSPDLATQDYVLFNKMKEPLRGRKFPTSDDLERDVHAQYPQRLVDCL